MIEIEAKRAIQLFSIGKTLMAGQKVVLETKLTPAQEKELSKAQKTGLIRMSEVKGNMPAPKPPAAPSADKKDEKKDKTPSWKK
jgi:hypothetical protein